MQFHDFSSRRAAASTFQLLVELPVEFGLELLVVVGLVANLLVVLHHDPLPESSRSVHRRVELLHEPEVVVEVVGQGQLLVLVGLYRSHPISSKFLLGVSSGQAGSSGSLGGVFGGTTVPPGVVLMVGGAAFGVIGNHSTFSVFSLSSTLD